MGDFKVKSGQEVLINQFLSSVVYPGNSKFSLPKQKSEELQI